LTFSLQILSVSEVDQLPKMELPHDFEKTPEKTLYLEIVELVLLERAVSMIIHAGL